MIIRQIKKIFSYLIITSTFAITNIHFKATANESIITNAPEKVIALQNPKYDIALVAIFRDEAMFLKEWIEFYRLIGVKHFYLFNHLSKDNFQEILQPYIDAGIVELENIHENKTTWSDWNDLQCKVYADTCKKVKNDVEWLLVVDTDEFLFPVRENDLPSVLKKYNDYAALSVNWQIFGCDTVEDIKSGELLIELLTKSSRLAAEDLHVKTIVKPRYVETFTNPHFPELQKGFTQINERHVPMHGPFLKSPSRDILRINHYWSRTWRFFREVKMSRPHMRDPAEKVIKQIQSYSVTEDTSIAKFIPALKERMQTPILLTQSQ